MGAKKEHVHHDYMNADRLGRGVPTDARSSAIVTMINGVEHRVHDGFGGVKSASVPSDPRLRRAHIEWKARNLIDPDL
jgi:hypothetical protein